MLFRSRSSASSPTNHPRLTFANTFKSSSFTQSHCISRAWASSSLFLRAVVIEEAGWGGGRAEGRARAAAKVWAAREEEEGGGGLARSIWLWGSVATSGWEESKPRKGGRSSSSPPAPLPLGSQAQDYQNLYSSNQEVRSSNPFEARR